MAEVLDTFHWHCRHTWRQSAKNTFWCLLGCSIGDFGTIAAFQFYSPQTSPLIVLVLAMTNGVLTSIALETFILRKQLGLDLPAHERYIAWLGGILQGDFGTSIGSGREIGEIIGVRFANTLFLATFAACIAVPTALILGVLAALYRNSWYDRTVNALTLSSISTPEFFVAYILILFVSVKLGWFPSLANVQADTTFLERLNKTLLPAVTLTLVSVAHMMRMTRAAIINLLAHSYIEMASLKGMRKARIIITRCPTPGRRSST